MRIPIAMDGKVIWIIVCLGIIGGGIVWNVSDFRSSPDSLPSCTVLQNGEGPGLVFFGTKEQTEQYMGALYAVKPFDEARERFSVSYIDSVKPSCELYKGIALLCYSRELVQQAAACPHDFIVVLEEHPASIRSSAFKNVISLNTAHQLSVFTHEFGHAFGDFAEEYTPASLPSSSDNCQSTCEKFDLKDGCYQGCSEGEYYRSIDVGIMRSLYATRYGTWHEAYLRKLLGIERSSIITGNAIAPRDCASQTYSLVTLNRSAGGLRIIDVAPGQGCGQSITSIDASQFIIFTDVQHDGVETISGETYPYQGIVYAAVSQDITTLQLTQNGQLIGEVHLGATLCKA